jgi:uncharacterized Zn finger protein (UPF0148 family)
MVSPTKYDINNLLQRRVVREKRVVKICPNCLAQMYRVESGGIRCGNCEYEEEVA